MAYGIPANVTSLAGRRREQRDAQYRRRKECSATTVHFGPCHAANTGLHHYVISLIATDLEPTAPKPGLTREEVMTAMTGHGKAVTAMVLAWVTERTMNWMGTFQ